MQTFKEFYEILEISPNANPDTIERVFRYLAMRYHPDNRDTGDSSRFAEVMAAHDTLKDSVQRARYDVQYKNQTNSRAELSAEAQNGKGFDRDAEIQERLLSLLYVKRRRNVSDPGIGLAELGRLSDCPPEHVEFHLWYLKEKGWVQRTQSGALAITVDGVDQVETRKHAMTNGKLLTHQSHQ